MSNAKVYKQPRCRVVMVHSSVNAFSANQPEGVHGAGGRPDMGGEHTIQCAGDVL